MVSGQAKTFHQTQIAFASSSGEMFFCQVTHMTQAFFKGARVRSSARSMDIQQFVRILTGAGVRSGSMRRNRRHRHNWSSKVLRPQPCVRSLQVSGQKSSRLQRAAQFNCAEGLQNAKPSFRITIRLFQTALVISTHGLSLRLRINRSVLGGVALTETAAVIGEQVKTPGGCPRPRGDASNLRGAAPIRQSRLIQK